MENIIKNLHYLTDVSQEDITKLEQAALLHRRHSRITFKILLYNEKQVKIEVRQEKSPAGNRFDQKRLVAIGHETFDRFFPGRRIIIHPIPYIESRVEQVTAEWIGKKMAEKNVRLKDIVEDTGIDKTQLSALINGVRPLSQVTKAMFYFYFLYRGKKNPA